MVPEKNGIEKMAQDEMAYSLAWEKNASVRIIHLT